MNMPFGIKRIKVTSSQPQYSIPEAASLKMQINHTIPFLRQQLLKCREKKCAQTCHGVIDAEIDHVPKLTC